MKDTKYSRKIEFYADLPNMPGSGEMATLGQMAKKALGFHVNHGWGFVGTPRVESTETNGRYKLSLLMRKTGQKRFDLDKAQEKADQLEDAILRRLSGWRRNPEITFVGQNGEVSEYTTDKLLDIPDSVMERFSHIYDRDVQIKAILRSIEVARQTNMRVRNHGLLIGPPGGGKTEVGLALSAVLGDVAVRRLDATATTKAGAERLLLDSDIVPPVIWIEELEKAAETNLPWLLGVLDSRGEIIKTTARMDVRRLANCLVFATVNDLEKFRSFHHGALLDRFSLPLYFPIPDESLLRKVLAREIELIPDGNPDWIEPAIRYALDIEKTYQIRRIKAIMTIGGNRLLDNSFQEEMKALRDKKIEDESRIQEFNMNRF